MNYAGGYAASQIRQSFNRMEQTGDRVQAWFEANAADVAPLFLRDVDTLADFETRHDAQVLLRDAKLTRQQRTALMLRVFGELTLDEAGAALNGVTRERVRQLQREAIGRLQKQAVRLGLLKSEDGELKPDAAPVARSAPINKLPRGVVFMPPVPPVESFKFKQKPSPNANPPRPRPTAEQIEQGRARHREWLLRQRARAEHDRHVQAMRDAIDAEKYARERQKQQWRAEAYERDQERARQRLHEQGWL